MQFCFGCFLHLYFSSFDSLLLFCLFLLSVFIRFVCTSHPCIRMWNIWSLILEKEVHKNVRFFFFSRLLCYCRQPIPKNAEKKSQYLSNVCQLMSNYRGIVFNLRFLLLCLTNAVISIICNRSTSYAYIHWYTRCKSTHSKSGLALRFLLFKDRRNFIY